MGHGLLPPELEQQKAVITEMVLPHYSRLLERSGFLWRTGLRMAGGQRAGLESQAGYCSQGHPAERGKRKRTRQA